MSYIKKKGMALPIVLIVGAVILLSSINLLALINSSMRIRKVSEDKMASKYAVQAAAEHALYLYDLNKKQTSVVANFTYNNGQVKDDMGKVLGRYSIQYTAPLSNSSIGTFNLTGYGNNVKGASSNSIVKAVLQINVQSGTVDNYKEN